MSNFYAVHLPLKDRGVYTSWNETKLKVHKVKGAKFKKFNSRKEAEAFAQMPPSKESKAPAKQQVSAKKGPIFFFAIHSPYEHRGVYASWDVVYAKIGKNLNTSQYRKFTTKELAMEFAKTGPKPLSPAPVNVNHERQMQIVDEALASKRRGEPVWELAPKKRRLFYTNPSGLFVAFLSDQIHLSVGVATDGLTGSAGAWGTCLDRFAALHKILKDPNCFIPRIIYVNDPSISKHYPFISVKREPLEFSLPKLAQRLEFTLEIQYVTSSLSDIMRRAEYEARRKFYVFKNVTECRF